LFEVYANDGCLSAEAQPRVSRGRLLLSAVGVLVAYAYDDRWNRVSLGEFFKRRLVRLQPMVVIGTGTVIGAVFFYLQSGKDR